MENCIYMFYNKLTNRYQGVFSFETDAKMQYTLGVKDAFDREELDVVKVGTYKVDNGVITPIPPVRIDTPLREVNPLPVSEAK